MHVSNKSVRKKISREPGSSETTPPIKTVIICQDTSLTTNTLTIIGETHQPSTRPQTLNDTRNISKEHSKSTSWKFRKQSIPYETCARTWTDRHPWNTCILTDTQSSQSTESTVENHCPQYTPLKPEKHRRINVFKNQNDQKSLTPPSGWNRTLNRQTLANPEDDAQYDVFVSPGRLVILVLSPLLGVFSGKEAGHERKQPGSPAKRWRPLVWKVPPPPGRARKAATQGWRWYEAGKQNEGSLTQ